MTGDAPSVQLAAAADRLGNGVPIRTPFFIHGSRGITVVGLDGADPKKVHVFLDDGCVRADLSDFCHSVEVDAPEDGPVEFTIRGYLTQSTLPTNARRVVVEAGRTFEVDTHDCPHMTALGETVCRWCGAIDVFDEPDIRACGDPAPPDPADDLCVCGHARRCHVYEEGPCRGGFVCDADCRTFVVAVDVIEDDGNPCRGCGGLPCDCP